MTAPKFDHTTASFTRGGEGQWQLDRDWAEYPPEKSEVEALAAATLVMNNLLSELVHHVAVGNLRVTEDLDGIQHLAVMQFLQRVDTFMVPQPVKKADEPDGAA